MFTLTANVALASDGHGLLINLPELHLTAWVATEAEIESELASLLRGFIKAERARGTLGQTIAGLIIEGEVPAPRDPVVPSERIREPTIHTCLQVGGAVPERELELTL
jgi:hypothetical protein